MLNTNAISRLKEIFEVTIESGLRYCGDYDHLDYYSLFCKAASADRLYKILGNNVCMFLSEYNNQEAVMMVFYIPINSDEAGAKNVAERVIDVVSLVEKCFVALDFLKSEEVKEDKFVYITAVKTLTKQGEN